MGWFKKEGEKPMVKEAVVVAESEDNYELPELPDIPELPEIPIMSSPKEKEKPQSLPIFPSNKLGEQLSQRSIKDAVSKRNNTTYSDMNLGMNPGFMSNTQQYGQSMPIKTQQKIFPNISEPPALRGKTKGKGEEPLFIRIDKFEESALKFNNVKEKLREAERMLSQVQQIKKHEESELATWESELRMLKTQIDEIDEDIFSKVE